MTVPQLLQQLKQLNQDSIAAYTESQSKVRHSLPIVSPAPAEEIAELERWLERLVAKFESGLIPPVRVGLTNWLAQVRADTIAAGAALRANRLPLDTRQELWGRLDALTAKALAKRQAEDPVLAEFNRSGARSTLHQPYRLESGDRSREEVRAEFKSTLDVLIFLAIENLVIGDRVIARYR